VQGKCHASKKEIKQGAKDVCGAVIDTEKDLEDLLAAGIYKCVYEKK
jgi:hypothetical protein